MLTVKLLTRPGCHLCDDVKMELGQLQADYPHQLVEVDITEDEELYNRYRFTIPVVQIESVELAAPITTSDLLLTLRTAARK